MTPIRPVDFPIIETESQEVIELKAKLAATQRLVKKLIDILVEERAERIRSERPRW